MNTAAPEAAPKTVPVPRRRSLAELAAARDGRRVKRVVDQADRVEVAAFGSSI